MHPAGATGRPYNRLQVKHRGPGPTASLAWSEKARMAAPSIAGTTSQGRPDARPPDPSS